MLVHSCAGKLLLSFGQYIKLSVQIQGDLYSQLTVSPICTHGKHEETSYIPAAVKVSKPWFPNNVGVGEGSDHCPAACIHGCYSKQVTQHLNMASDFLLKMSTLRKLFSSVQFFSLNISLSDGFTVECVWYRKFQVH